MSYVAAGRAHGVIVSIDGRGQVTLHFPADAGAPTALESGRAVPLSHSYELDDAPLFERFMFVTAEAPDDLLAKLRFGIGFRLNDDFSLFGGVSGSVGIAFDGKPGTDQTPIKGKKIEQDARCCASRPGCSPESASSRRYTPATGRWTAARRLCAPSPRR